MGMGTAGDLDRRLNDPPDSALCERIRRAVELHESTVADIAQVLRVTGTQLYRFLDGSRGLPQARIDKLCAFLGLFVEGPPEVVPPRVRGAMPTMRRRIYLPRPRPGAVGSSEAEWGMIPTTRPSSLSVPPADEPADNS